MPKKVNLNRKPKNQKPISEHEKPNVKNNIIQYICKEKIQQ